MALFSEEMIALPMCTLYEVEEALLKRLHKELSEIASIESKEEKPCWWVLSALDRFDGREAREAYYSKL